VIRVPLVTVQHTARVASLRAIVDATEAVDSYCVDYLDAEGAVDLEYLGTERVEHVRRTLAELDGIVSASDELAATNTITADAHLFAVTVHRARSLAAAIREALTGAPAEVDETAAVMAPRSASTHEAAGQ